MMMAFHVKTSDLQHRNVAQTFLKNTKKTRVKRPIEQKDFLREVREMLWLFRIIGIVPRPTGTGASDRLCTVGSWIYSVLIYGVVIAVSVLVLRTRIPLLLSLYEKGDFDVTMTEAIIIVFLFHGISIAPTCWYESRSHAKFLGDWFRFQHIYNTISGSPLSLSLHYISRVLVAVLLTISVFLTVATLQLKVFYEWWHCIPFSYCFLIVFGLPAYWTLCMLALRQTAQHMTEELQKLCAVSFLPVEILSEYKKLWLELNALVHLAGQAFGYTGVTYLVSVFIVICTIAYKVLSGISNGLDGTGLCMLAGGLFSAMNVFFVANSAYETIQQVGPRFRRELHKLHFTIPRSRKIALYVVREFLHVMKVKPPKITLHGLLDLDRAFLVGFAASIVSDLVILLQMRISSPTPIPHDATENATIKNQ